MSHDKRTLSIGARSALLVATGLVLAVAARAGDPLFASYGTEARGQLDSPMKARTVSSLDLSFVIPDNFVDDLLGRGAQAQIGCEFTAKNGGQPVKGVKVTGSASVEVSGQTIDLGSVSGKTSSNGTVGSTFDLNISGPLGSPATISASFDPSGGKRVDTWSANCFGQVFNPQR